MEYVGGRPLKAVIPTGGLKTTEVLNYGAQLAGALAHVHQRGIIHRDVKASNVIITPKGKAKLLDFGLATRVRQTSQEQQSASWSSKEYSVAMGGTVPYMAPEVLRGERAIVQSDLWTLGV